MRIIIPIFMKKDGDKLLYLVYIEIVMIVVKILTWYRYIIFFLHEVKIYLRTCDITNETAI